MYILFRANPNAQRRQSHLHHHDGLLTPPLPSEFKKIAFATGIGVAVMGFIGFFVKLIHIPINNIIIGGSA